MKNTKKLSKRSIVKGSYKHLVTIAMLMLLMFATAGRASAVEAKTAYAVLKDGTLTFYYDVNFDSHTETDKWTFPDPLKEPSWSENENITKVKITNDFKKFSPTSCSSWFHCLINLQSISGLENINTDNVTKMDFMFYHCRALESLDLSSFNTGRVTNMYGMFRDCAKLETLNLSNFNTKKVEKQGMNDMFYECYKLTSVLVGDNWQVPQTEDIQLSKGKVIKTTPYAVLSDNPDDKTKKTLTFYCDQYKEDNNGIELNNTGQNPGWFNVRESITKVVFDEGFKYARPVYCYHWFNTCKNLTEIKGIENLNTSEVINMQKMFCNCSSIESLDLRNFNTKKVQIIDLMFASCTNLTTILVGDDWDVSSANYDDLIFDNCNKLIGGKGTEYTSTNTASNYAIVDGTNSKKGYLTSIDQCQPYVVIIGNTITFYCDQKRSTFNDAKDLDYSKWTYYANNIYTVKFDDSFKYARPTSCKNWFQSFSKITGIEGFKNLNTSLVTDMSGMFMGCTFLSSLDFSNFDTKNVIDMSSMFYDCRSLTSLDLSSFNTEAVENMYYMFSLCVNLESIDLSNFNTKSVSQTYGMFSRCPALKTIMVGTDWDMSSVTDYTTVGMFSECGKLIGGNGTTYDENSTDKTYALIDGSNNKPGYLTNINHQNLSIALKSGVEYTYNGKAIIPEITVTDGSQTLKLGTDYTVSTPTEFINAGEYKDVEVTFEGIGKYIGKKAQKVTFTINPKTISTATISLNKTEFTYTGEAQTPAVKVSYLNDNGETQTLASTDYTVAYTNNTKAGKATITIAAVSGTNYTFENLTKSFDIVLKYKDPVYTWNSDYTSCTVTKEGINTATAAVTETTTNITKEILKAASTTETGKVKYTAAFENFSDDIKEVETPKLDPENNNNENPNTPVSSITDAPIVKVWAYNKTIYITSAPDSQYKIIDLQGRIIATSTTTSTTQQIKMTRSGVYVIIINNQSFKVSL